MKILTLAKLVNKKKDIPKSIFFLGIKSTKQLIIYIKTFSLQTQ